METMTKKLYEAMFLIDSAQAGSDWDGTLAAVKRVLERAEAEIEYLEKWVDRRLAFEIAHKARGTYILCYFRAAGSKIAGIEKDVNLSEQIMRVLILTAEDRPGDSVQRDLAGETKAPQELYARDDRRPGPRKREDAASQKADRQDKKPDDAANAEAAGDSGPEAPATVDQGTSGDDGGASEVASTVDAPVGQGETSGAAEPGAAAPETAGADEGASDPESEKG